MAIHAIFGISEVEKAERDIAQAFGEDNVFQITGGDWLVHSDLTSAQIRDQIKDQWDTRSDKPPQQDSAKSSVYAFLVVPLSTYSGYHYSDTWEWIGSKEGD